MASSPPSSRSALGLELLESMWIEFGITTFVVAARLYTRVILVGKVHWDDILMITAFLVTLGAFILNNLAVNAGFGQHAQDLNPQSVVEAVKWAFLGQVLGIMGSAFARMAFITTLVHLLSPQQRIQLWLLRGFFSIQVCINSITALYILLQCRPTYGLWNHTPGAVCLPPYIQEHLGFGQGTINAFSDLALSIFPATVIWKLNMKRSIKVSLCATMGLGVFAFATAVIKTVNLKEINANPNDLTYIMFGIQFWFSIENSTLIISATIPTLRPLFTHRRASENPRYDVHDRGSHRRWNRPWNEIEAPARLASISGCSDQIELTDAIKDGFGSGTDTQCVAAAGGDAQRAGDPRELPPETGILKTMSTDVTGHR